MRIIVYGLGLIGGSFAAALRRAGHTVYGRNRTPEVCEFALQTGMISKATEDYGGAEVVILALPPEVTMQELDTGDFPDGCIVVDICGVKGKLEELVYSKPRNYRYVGIHPMAGKETCGIYAANADLFNGANLIVCRSKKSDRLAAETVKTLARQIGFKRIVECSAAMHDREIAFTSQLAHILSNAYARSPLTSTAYGFTGGSFEDLTRVATMDERVWAELFLLNKENLLPELSSLIDRLSGYREALEAGDGAELKELIRLGKASHDEFYRKKH